MNKITIEQGTRFGKWTVIAEAEIRNGQTTFMCRCDCGKEKSVHSASLRRGESVQCASCARRIPNTGQRTVTHGMHKTRAYQSWAHMKNRCQNENNDAWRYYGARGIKVCERWQTFEYFYADMGDPPSRQSIDRINNNGDYEPGNCRWATAKEQINNRSCSPIYRELKVIR